MNDIKEGYHSNEAWSYGSLPRVAQHNRQISKKDIDAFLTGNEIYTRFKQYKSPRKYSPIFVYSKRELFQADVVFFTDKDMVKVNSGYKYLFTCIDCFSKMAWVYPMKANTCDNVMNCFKDILDKCGKPPQRLNSDRGSELICKKFENFLKENNIFHYLSYSVRKCPIVERFNLSFQNILYKIMAHNRTLIWFQYIEQAMDIYLKREHSTIGMSPLEAEKEENSVQVRKNLLSFFHKRGLRRRKPKFKVNDTVRIWKKRGTFQRGYDENFSREYFRIQEVKTNLPVPRYVLADSKGEVIKGAFFGEELVKFQPTDTFEIQVLQTRGVGQRTEYLVHYIGYPKHMDEWISKKKLVKL